MTPSRWAPTGPWISTPWEPIPSEPPGAAAWWDPWVPAVIQTADWTCSCASSAWLLNALGDGQLGREWNEWDVVDTLRAATYYGAVSPDYGLARADMYDLEVMFNTLGYDVDRVVHAALSDALALVGTYPTQANGAAWYHHTGMRAFGPGVILLANPAPSWKGVGQELSASEAGAWGSWNLMSVLGRL